MLLYYPIGMAMFYSVDDDVNLEPSATVCMPGSSKAIATAITLIEREADQWAPNLPFWHPGSLLTYMPNFQSGLMYAISRFAVEMDDQSGRTRGSSAIDPDLGAASAALDKRTLESSNAGYFDGQADNLIHGYQGPGLRLLPAAARCRRRFPVGNRQQRHRGDLGAMLGSLRVAADMYP